MQNLLSTVLGGAATEQKPQWIRALRALGALCPTWKTSTQPRKSLPVPPKAPSIGSSSGTRWCAAEGLLSFSWPPPTHSSTACAG